MKTGIDISLRYHEYREPIRVFVDMPPLARALNSIDWHTIHYADREHILAPNTPEQTVKHILSERKYFAEKLAEAICQALHKLDTYNGYSNAESKDVDGGESGVDSNRVLGRDGS